MSSKAAEAIKAEFVRCKQDPVYWMKKYYTIQHPTRGRLPFLLYPFQEKVLRLFERHEYTILNKSRQLGISTLTSAFALWLMLFHQDKNILVQATTQAIAKNMVTKVRFAYDNLPTWMRLPVEEHNRLSLRLKNGSQIKAVSAATDNARSEAVSLLIIDEAGFIEKIDKIYTAAQQTLATGGRCIVVSTPNGQGNWFHSTFTKAEIGENQFIAIRLPWHVHPERDQAWRDQQTIELGHRAASQECDCDFTTSGDTVIEPETLKFFEENTVCAPIEKRGTNKEYWLWSQPDPTKTYMVVADVARGTGRDFSTFHVLDVETLSQEAEFKSQMPTKEFARFLVSVAIEWNEALLVVENTGIGWDVVTTIEEMSYRNLYYSPTSEMAGAHLESYITRFDKGTGMVPGFSMNLKTRPLVVERGRSFLDGRQATVRSQRLAAELRVFIWKNEKAQAMSGYNDDLVIPFFQGLYLRDTALRFRQAAYDLTYASLNNFSKSTQGFEIYTPANTLTYNPWKLDLGTQGQEDLTWLLG